MIPGYRSGKSYDRGTAQDIWTWKSSRGSGTGLQRTDTPVAITVPPGTQEVNQAIESMDPLISLI